MDILDIVVQHIHDQIIRAKSAKSIREYHIRNPQRISIPAITFVVEGEEAVVPENIIEALVHVCTYVYDIVRDHDGPITIELPNIVTKDGFALLCTYIQEVKPPIRSSDKKGDAYIPISLYSVEPWPFIRDTDRKFFDEFFFTREGINWGNVRTLLHNYDTFNFLGCEPFCIYTFIYLYVISGSLSISEREERFGHRYFMLPIEGWESPLRNTFSIPFLKEEDVEGCTDVKHREITHYLHPRYVHMV